MLNHRGLLPPPRTGRADFPHLALTETLASDISRELRAQRSQVNQPQLLKVPVHRYPFRQAKGSLAPTF